MDQEWLKHFIEHLKEATENLEKRFPGFRGWPNHTRKHLLEAEIFRKHFGEEKIPSLIGEESDDALMDWGKQFKRLFESQRSSSGSPQEQRPGMADSDELRRNTWWVREGRNPVLPPGAPGTFDSTACMNPWVMLAGDRLRVRFYYAVYYAGGDDAGHRRVCLATAPLDDPANWRRHGPLLELGPPGSFDAHWCVLPHVVQAAPDRWHLYYTGNSGTGRGLSAFPGMGLALSPDGIQWEKYPGNPILERTGRAGDPDAVGIAGGSVLKVRLPDGTAQWRFYYTGCPTLGDDVFLNQQKCVCLAVSPDGIRWERRGAVLRRDPDRDYENVAVAGPVVHQEEDGSFRMWYSAIGTRWGWYSICYAESEDGLHWRRGTHYGDNLQLGPLLTGWEGEMVEYPSVLREAGRLRLFYCGSGYGRTGIGTAVSSPLRATATRGLCRVRIVAPQAGACWNYRIPEGLSCEEGVFKSHQHPEVDWQGPNPHGALWHEWQTNDRDFAVIRTYPHAAEFGLKFIQGIAYRVMVTPSEAGLELQFTAQNLTDGGLHNVTVFPCLSAETEGFHDPALERTFIVTAEGLTPLKDTDRGTGDPRRTHYHVAAQRPMRFYGAPFWGEASRTAATGGAILRSDSSGRFTVGTAWESVCELFQNEDAHHCIHSVATLGDLAPGETRTVRGRIVFAEGGPEKALELLHF